MLRNDAFMDQMASLFDGEHDDEVSNFEVPQTYLFLVNYTMMACDGSGLNKKKL